jgi:hypothetical protein
VVRAGASLENPCMPRMALGLSCHLVAGCQKPSRRNVRQEACSLLQGMSYMERSDRGLVFVLDPTSRGVRGSAVKVGQ